MFAEEIEPLISMPRRGSRPAGFILEHEATRSLYINKAGRALLDSAGGASTRRAFAPQSEEAEPTYFRGRDASGGPIPYTVDPLSEPPRTSADARLDEYIGIADVLTRFIECEAGVLTTHERRCTLERVEVYAKPSDVEFSLDNKRIQ